MLVTTPDNIPTPTQSQPLAVGRLVRPLQLFSIYRVVLASLFAILFFSGMGPDLLGKYNAGLFSLVVISYVGFTLASGVILFQQISTLIQKHVFFMVLIDILALTLMMHASGGVESGIGILIIASIAAGSLIAPGLLAIFTAAIASLAILAEQAYAEIIHAFDTTAYTQAGMLGVSYFAIAIVATVLSLQLRKSEMLASQSKLDLANMEQLNEYVIQHMHTGIVIVDAEGRIRMMNDSAWNLLGMPTAKSNIPLEQACMELANQLTYWTSDKNFENLPFRPTAGGRELQAGISALGNDRDGGVVIFLEDAAKVTQRAQQMKLASLGRLTASIAHEVRNPLGAISHAEQLLRESQHLPADDVRLIDIISTNSKRVNEIIENIMQLSRRDLSQPVEFKLEPWLDRFIVEFIQAQELDEKNIRLQIIPVSTVIYADPTQFRQIMINLCENALYHSKRQKGNFRLQINGGISPESGNPFTEVIDNGPGIPPETVRQIFEPFFTTENAGTGLGLYIARELSESNRLRLEYVPIPTGGSCFKLTFPTIKANILPL